MLFHVVSPYPVRVAVLVNEVRNEYQSRVAPSPKTLENLRERGLTLRIDDVEIGTDRVE
jgi:hypothetical protein